MRNIPIKKSYLAVWAALYLGFLILDLITPNSEIVTALKLAGILLCLIYTLLYSKSLLLRFAFLLTVLADLFLALNNTSIAGVITFCFVQFAHFIRLKNASLKISIVLYLGVLLVLAASSLLKIDAHYLLATIYCSTLIANIVLAKKSDNMSFVGFLLFLCCDIMVAVSFLASTGAINSALHPVADYLAWMFYLPSQVLIACAPAKLPQKSKKFAKVV